MADFEPVRPGDGGFSPVNPTPPAPRVASFVPSLSITDEKVAYGLSPRKLMLIGAKVYRSTNQSFTSGAAAAMVYDTEVYDEGGFWNSAAPTRLTAPYDGVYTLTLYTDFVSNDAGDRRGTINLNGVVTIAVVRTPTVGRACALLLHETLKLTAGDYIEYALTQTSGVALNAQSGEDGNFATMHFLGAI